MDIDHTPQLTTTVIGFRLDPGLSYTDWSGKLYWAALISAQANWYLADVLNHPHAESDEGLQLIAELQKMPRFAHLTDGTLSNIKSIGARYSIQERTDLSWSHHAAVAYVQPPEARAQMLEEAKLNDLTVKDLREKAKDGNSNRAAKRPVDASDSGSDEEREDAPTREDFDDARKRCLRQLRDFCAILKDREIDVEGVLKAAIPVQAALVELIELGENL